MRGHRRRRRRSSPAVRVSPFVVDAERVQGLASVTFATDPGQAPTSSLCEFVRTRSLRAHASVRMCARFVNSDRVSLHVPTGFKSLRGWRSQERESSNLSFRTIRLARRLAFHREPSGSLMAGHRTSNALSEPEGRVEGLHACEAVRDDAIVVRMVWVYLLRCSDGTFYVGHTSDLLAREQAHNEGRGGIYTALRRPVRVVYSEPYKLIESAVARERQLKRWTKAKKLALISEDRKRLKELTRRHHRRRTTKLRELGHDRD